MGTYNSTGPGKHFDAAEYQKYLDSLTPQELIEECTRRHEDLQELFDRIEEQEKND